MENNIIKAAQSGQSPFDSIKHFDSQGREFWTGRELMPLLGYAKWQKFEEVIVRSQFACQNSGSNIDKHFDYLPAAVNGRGEGRGSKGADFKLSKYAAYLIAMNGDSRKPEIAAAQTYFAIKTHEAETVIPQQNERIRELELESQIARDRKYILDKSSAIVQLHGAPMLALMLGNSNAVVEIKETITESIVCRDGKSVSFVGKSLAELAKKYGFKTGKEFERWLESVGGSYLVDHGLRVVGADYVQTENLAMVARLFAEYRTNSNRQLLLGEN
ncbi:MAG: BRO family protein [Waterburya sp.]